MFAFKKVTGTYDYLNKVKDEETLEGLMELLVTFMKTCHRPHHIEADVVRPFYAFGKEGYL